MYFNLAYYYLRRGGREENFNERRFSPGRFPSGEKTRALPRDCIILRVSPFCRGATRDTRVF